MIKKWLGRFEVKPNRWVYHPTDDTIKSGKKIISDVARVWSAPYYYFHLRTGGHIEALRLHLRDKFFVHLDLADFFGSVNKTRVTRCLKSRLGYEEGRQIAEKSTVQHPNGYKLSVLPYGFPQSSILASIALYDSSLGHVLHKFAKSREIRVSIYVDDIILSCDSIDILNECISLIRISAIRSKFELNENKTEGPSSKIRAFNIEISYLNMEISADRLELFRCAVLESENISSIESIITYVSIVNKRQGIELQLEALNLGKIVVI